MKVIDRGTVREAEEELPELPHGVEIPDDLRGLEPPGRPDRKRPTGTVRWLRWLPLVLLVAVGAFVAAGVVDGETGDTTVPWSIDEGPGSSSLDGAVATQSVALTVTRGPFAPGDGPGEHSLTVPIHGPWFPGGSPRIRIADLHGPA